MAFADTIDIEQYPQREPMKPEVKAAWLAALRSGEYTQTKGVLNRIEGYEDAPKGFCCLGVLCEVAVKQGLDISVNVSLDDPETMDYDGLSGVLPRSVMKWAGIANNAGMYQQDDEATKYLSSDNDNGKSFEEIAAIIEERF